VSLLCRWCRFVYFLIYTRVLVLSGYSHPPPADDRHSGLDQRVNMTILLLDTPPCRLMIGKLICGSPQVGRRSLADRTKSEDQVNPQPRCHFIHLRRQSTRRVGCAVPAKGATSGRSWHISAALCKPLIASVNPPGVCHFQSASGRDHSRRGSSISPRSQYGPRLAPRSPATATREVVQR